MIRVQESEFHFSWYESHTLGTASRPVSEGIRDIRHHKAGTRWRVQTSMSSPRECTDESYEIDLFVRGKRELHQKGS